jgi:hypothetical protein
MPRYKGLEKTEGRAVIGVGAPFDAQLLLPGVSGVEIRSQLLSKLSNFFC